MVKIKKKKNHPDNTKHWQGCGTIISFTHCWWECKMVQPLWNIVLQFLTKLNIILPEASVITVLGIHPKMSWKLISTQKPEHKCL